MAQECQRGNWSSRSHTGSCPACRNSVSAGHTAEAHLFGCSPMCEYKTRPHCATASGEPACLDAGLTVFKLVVAANP